MEFIEGRQVSLCDPEGLQARLELVGLDDEPLLPEASYIEPVARSAYFNFELEENAYYTFQVVRSVLANLSPSCVEYQLFDERENRFVILDPRLDPMSWVPSFKKMNDCLKTLGLEPLYFFLPTKAIYALNKKNEVEIVNAFLLKNISEKGWDEEDGKELRELTYQVADKLEDFDILFARGLIPTSFYKFYRKKRKIVNYSHINIENPGRKVFVKPHIYCLRDFRSGPYVKEDRGVSLLFMDKIRKGETLNDTLIRVIKDELQVAEDYIGAIVHEELEFDRDRFSRLTPRLIVSVYVENLSENPQFKRIKQLDWVSVDGSTPRLEKRPPRKSGKKRSSGRER